jgi:hypothetical protein
LFDLHGRGLSLQLAGPGSGDISSGAALNLDLADVSMSAQASASAGTDEGHGDLWRKQSAQVEAHWSGPAGSDFTAQGADEFNYSYRDPASLGDPGTATHLMGTENRSLKVSGSVPLVGGASVEAGMDATSAQTEDGSAPHAADRDTVGTRTREAFAKVRWQMGRVGLEAGAAAHSENVSVRALDSRQSSYTSVNPRAQVDVAPWDGATLTSSVEQAVAPYDTAAFSAYAQAARPDSSLSFTPDHTLRFQSRLQQDVGPASVSVSYAADRGGTATEFAQAASGQQVPASTQLLERNKVDVAVSLPLSAFGLPNTALHSDAAWQDSRVVDPMTSTVRSASGETPHKFSLRVSHDMPARHLSFGLTGELSGARSSYQVSEISTSPSAGTMGAFLAFKPGPYEVDLNVNGIGGATTTDYFYRSTRADSSVGRTAEQAPAGPAVSLSLHKAL